MSLLDKIEVNKPIPYHCDYKQMVIECEFFEEAIEVSADYWNVKDPNGNEALKKFTCEDKADHKWRKQVSTPKNYVGSILNKYLSTCFQNKATRQETDVFTNVDLLGSTMPQFMQYATKQALIDGCSYIVPDSTISDSSMSELQRKVIGAREFLRLVTVEDTINWVDYLGHLMEIIIRFEDINEQKYYLHYDAEYVTRINVNERDVVTSIDAPIAHGKGTIPVVRVMPFDTDQSFVASGANMQLSINNLNSLEKVEIYKSTFTRYFAKGFDLNRDSDGNPIPIEWGNERVFHASSDSADMKVLGASVDQADSIRKSIDDETQSLFRHYHLSASAYNEQNQVPSGYSLVISRSDFNSICSKIVQETERAENEVIKLVAPEVTPTIYSRTFIEPDKAEAISNLRDILSLAIPDDIKAQEIESFRNKFYVA